ncbi:MAG: hypothetical protein M0Z59_06820 [Nitrospiraceae bacterium]|nr:hypothetical protein [Nitrospiraceae bacterium]
MRARILAVVFFSFLAMVVFTSFANVKAGPKVTFFGLNSEGKSKPNGEYGVEVFSGGKWVRAGALSFDKFYREKRLDLSGLVKPGEQARIRLIERGGGAAHIDSVSLGGAAPQKVGGTPEPLAMKKLAAKDFDVLDAFGKTIELSFSPAAKAGSVLTLVARVENKVISKATFKFPATNSGPFTAHSHFMRYRLGESKQEPFFKEASISGSGHPSGFTYGWVNSDKKYLHVKIDFTPDDTMDGNKDFSKVYVKTARGVKAFKESMQSTKWGHPQFTYTDKVSYQHKVYDFRIPLSELGMKPGQKEVQLAFETYGTASPASYVLAMAYDPANDSYLVVYFKEDGVGLRIKGQLVNGDGTLKGGELAIANLAGFPVDMPVSVAYGRTDKKYLVVWSDRGTHSEIYGQFVNVDGSLSDGEMRFTSADLGGYDAYHPNVAWDSTDNQFLITWQDTSDGNIHGSILKFLNPGWGTQYLNAITDTGYADYPRAAFDSVTGQYLLVWIDSLEGTVVGGIFIGADGTFDPTSLFPISDFSFYPHWADVAFNPAQDNFLVSYDDDASEVYGQIVNADGAVGSPMALDNTTAAYTSATYDAHSGRYIVGYLKENAGYGNISAVFVNGVDGSAEGSPFMVTDRNDIFAGPAMAYNNREANTLCAFPVYNGSVFDLAVTLIGGPNHPPTAPGLVYPANGATGIANSVEFKWDDSTDDDGDDVSYQVLLSKDGGHTFRPADHLTVKSNLHGAGLYAGAGSLLLFGAVFVGGLRGRRRFLAILLLLAVLASGVLISCHGSDTATTPGAPKATTQTVNLPPGQYWWKVVAADSKGGQTESQVWSFTVGPS